MGVEQAESLLRRPPGQAPSNPINPMKPASSLVASRGSPSLCKLAARFPHLRRAEVFGVSSGRTRKPEALASTEADGDSSEDLLLAEPLHSEYLRAVSPASPCKHSPRNQATRASCAASEAEKGSGQALSNALL